MVFDEKLSKATRWLTATKIILYILFGIGAHIFPNLVSLLAFILLIMLGMSFISLGMSITYIIEKIYERKLKQEKQEIYKQIGMILIDVFIIMSMLPPFLEGFMEEWKNG